MGFNSAFKGLNEIVMYQLVMAGFHNHKTSQ